MTDINNTSSGADTAVMGFDRPSQTPPLLPGRMQDDIDTWSTLVDRVREAAQRRGWTKAEVARRAGMASGTFSQWYSGNYAGRLDRQNDIISRWLDALDDQAALAATIPTGPAFLRLKAADEIVQTLRWAQLCPDLVVITAGSGVGKTAACSHYLRTVPHSHMVTISPHTKTVHGLLCAIVETLGINQRNPARYVEAIGRRLETTGGGALLIVDEAQNLVDEAINQLRHFVDRHGCGIALVGNDEIYSRFTKRSEGPSYAQLKSRVGKRLKRTKPYPEDVAAYIDAWGVTEPEAIRFLTGIGMKGGHLRQIEKTMKLASMLALGSGEGEVTLQHIRSAWMNRDVEDMA